MKRSPWVVRPPRSPTWTSASCWTPRPSRAPTPIHPGYGFLSENADFAQAVIDAGLIWIGPSPQSIRDLGDKVTARHIAARAQAPLVPGTPDPVKDADEVVAFAKEYGVPIAIKAAFGGGGRGMKVARTIEEIPELFFESATREAVAAFGRGECFVERYLDKPRHVEAQVIADQHGNVVVAGTRDCSLQRRFQKLVEEAPAPFLTDAQRKEIGVRVLNQEIIQWGGISADELAAVEARERREVERRAFRYRRGRPRQPLGGCVAVVVDDGIATGSTARAACQVARAQGAARVVLAVPVAPPGWRARMGRDADELVCVQTPRSFSAIGQFYADFAQTTDDEVTACLERAAAPPRRCRCRAPAAAPVPVPGPGAAPVGDPPDWDEDVEVSAGAVRLAGQLAMPDQASGIVVFAHGSGSSRHSPRNRYVAAVLNQAALGTLLFDLLSPDEQAYRANVFDIGLLARRRTGVTRWLRAQAAAAGLPVGYFGASTGAAAALWAAAEPGSGIAAVVSRGGLPTWPARASGRSGLPHCLSSAGTTMLCSASTGRLRPGCAARTTWPWCPARPTCSRSQALSQPPPSWPVTGSPGISSPARTRSPGMAAPVRRDGGPAEISAHDHWLAAGDAGLQVDHPGIGCGVQCAKDRERQDPAPARLYRFITRCRAVNWGLAGWSRFRQDRDSWLFVCST